MAKKEYISVNSTTNKTNQLVKLVNHDNEFTGKIMSAGSNGGAQDVRDLFIAELRVDGEQVDETIENNKRIVNIHVPDVEQVNPTKVFTANDPTGSSSIDSLVLTPQDTPVDGDILIVTHALGNGNNENSAYIYNNGWQACSGNVDASKVILTSNFTMSGMYDRVGNFVNNGGSVQANGLSVQELFRKMFYEELPEAIYFAKAFPRGSVLTENEISNLNASQVQTFEAFNSLPNGFSVSNAVQVLFLVPQIGSGRLTATTGNNLPYTITKLEGATFDVNGTTYVAWEILEDSSFSDTIKFAWA